MKVNKKFAFLGSIFIVIIFFYIFNKIITKDMEYVIELDEFNISNDNNNAKETTEGINNALKYAKNQGYKIVKLPEGHYAIDTSVISPIVLSDGENQWIHNRQGIVLQSDIELIMTDVILEMIPTDDPYYSIVTISNCENSKIIGGTILGDRDNHDYGMRINEEEDQLESGSFDENTGLPIDDDTKVRTKDFIDNFNGQELPEKFFLTVLENTTKNTTDGGVRYIYCYDINEKYLGIAEGGNSFTDKATLLPGTSKIKVAFKDENRLDAVYYITDEETYPTHEFGTGITITDSDNIEINNVTIKSTVGDCIATNAPTIKVTVDNLKIINCTLENSRRQGISFVSTGENYLISECNIGKINGTDPQCGIDIEHYDYVKNIVIDKSNFYDNKKWDIINYNGYDIEIKDSNFMGGIGSTYGYNMDIHDNNFIYRDEKWLDKTFKGVLFALNTNNEDGYFKIYNNLIDGYSSSGGNPTSNLKNSEFKNNKVKNSTIVIGSNAFNNTYENSTIRYSLCNYEYKNEKFINCIIGGENNGDNIYSRYYTNFEMNNCEFLTGNPSVVDTVLTNCKIYNSDKSFCSKWGGKYTLKNCEINTEYTKNIPFISSQGVEAIYSNCKMNLSLTPFIALNYGNFFMKDCEIHFNDSYKMEDETLEFVKNVYGKSKFINNNFEDNIVEVILPD